MRIGMDPLDRQAFNETELRFLRMLEAAIIKGDEKAQERIRTALQILRTAYDD